MDDDHSVHFGLERSETWGDKISSRHLGLEMYQRRFWKRYEQRTRKTCYDQKYMITLHLQMVVFVTLEKNESRRMKSTQLDEI